MLHVKRRKWRCYSQNADHATINLGDDNLLPTFELHCLSTQLNIKYTVLYTSSLNGWRISLMAEITLINCMRNCKQCEAKRNLVSINTTKSSYSDINKTQSLWSCWKVNEKDGHSLISEIHSTSFLQLCLNDLQSDVWTCCPSRDKVVRYIMLNCKQVETKLSNIILQV